jgi:hypothetical protein
MPARNLFIASSPLSLLESAALARQQGTRSQLVLLEDFALAQRLERLCRRWRDNPFEAILRLPGRFEEAHHVLGPQQGARALAQRRARRRERLSATLAKLRELDARFEPDAVWVGDDRKLEVQYALHLASQRNRTRVGRFLDDGLPAYLGRRPPAVARRIEAIARRLAHGGWSRYVAQAGTSPWIVQSLLAFPAEALDQAAQRMHGPLPREAFGGRDFQRLAIGAAREFKLDRDALRACSVVLLLPAAERLRGDATLQLRLRRLLEGAEACGRRVAFKSHADDPPGGDAAGPFAEGAALALPRLLPDEWLPALLPRGALLAGDASTALLAARWLRPDLAVSVLDASAGERAVRAQALCARHGIGLLDETALSAGV